MLIFVLNNNFMNNSNDNNNNNLNKNINIIIEPLAIAGMMQIVPSECLNHPLLLNPSAATVVNIGTGEITKRGLKPKHNFSV